MFSRRCQLETRICKVLLDSLRPTLREYGNHVDDLTHAAKHDKRNRFEHDIEICPWLSVECKGSLLSMSLSSIVLKYRHLPKTPIPPTLSFISFSHNEKSVRQFLCFLLSRRFRHVSKSRLPRARKILKQTFGNMSGPR